MMKTRLNETVLLAIVVATLLIPGLWWGMPSAVSPQVDSTMPLGPLLLVAEWKRAEANITYPVFHQLLQLPLYGVAAAVFWLRGEIGTLSTTWPYGFRDPSLFFSTLTIISNAVSAAMAVGIILLARRLSDTPLRWFILAGLLLATNGTFVYYGRVGNMDLPYVFWWALATVLLWSHVERRRSRRALVGAGAAAALAIASKDQAAGLVLGSGIALLAMELWQASDGRQRGAAIRSALTFSMSVIFVYALAAIAPNPLRWWNHVLFVTSPHAPTDLPHTWGAQWTMLGRTGGEIITVFGWPLLVVAAIGVFRLVRSEPRKLLLVLLPIVTYYVLVIGMTRVVYPRFMLPFFVPLLVATAYGAWQLYEGLVPAGPGLARRLVTVGLALLLAWTLATSYYPTTYTMTHDLRRSVADDLPGFVVRGSPLLVARMQAHNLPNRDVYAAYRVMMVPGDVILPASRNTASILAPFDPSVGFFLLGSGTAGVPTHVPFPAPVLSGELLKEWKYPDWMRRWVVVPTWYEFALYRRTGPIPTDYRPPEAALKAITGNPRLPSAAR